MQALLKYIIHNSSSGSWESEEEIFIVFIYNLATHFQ